MNDRQLRNFVIGLGLGVSGFGLAAVSLPTVLRRARRSRAPM